MATRTLVDKEASQALEQGKIEAPRHHISLVRRLIRPIRVRSVTVRRCMRFMKGSRKKRPEISDTGNSPLIAKGPRDSPSTPFGLESSSNAARNETSQPTTPMTIVPTLEPSPQHPSASNPCSRAIAAWEHSLLGSSLADISDDRYVAVLVCIAL